jgi:pimeloyl-ACP methyl ester carboxylesterase
MASKHWIRRGLIVAAAIAIAALGYAGPAGAIPMGEVAEHGFIYAGGHYIDTPAGQVITGQMYVEYFFPRTVTHRYPIVMLTGGGPTGALYEGTPDGRPGWADYYLQHGWKVYVTDQVARGRSLQDSKIDGPAGRDTVKSIEERLSISERFQLWPQAKLHSQWPGAGTPGDPIFDQFMASRVTTLASNATMEALDAAALADLLDRIGPAIVQTHSQSGTHGWRAADLRPNLVKAVVAVEPNGPPYKETTYVGPPEYFGPETVGRPWGITNGLITYAPAVKDPAELTFVQEEKAAGPDKVRCWSQQAPARQLPRLALVKILIVTTEASYHAPYDHCTSNYLTQAGVKHDWIRLADLGIHGNGHDMMIEKNNLAIAAVMAGWLAKQGL